MSRAEGRKQFEEEVFPGEIEQINRRRKNLGLPPVVVPNGPSASANLVGLCLSGGGIRSATFSLGVIQALSKHRMLKSVDYLSTVSGGGYTGSCLSSLLNDPETGSEGEKFPFRETLGRDEPRAVSHLRNSSNYLAPVTILDKLRIPALILRGVISNFLLFLFWVIIAVMATELVYEILSQHFRLAFSTIVSVVFGLFLLMVLGYPLLFRLFRGRINWRNRDRSEFWFTLVWLLSLITVFMVPVVILVNQAINISFGEFREHVENSFNRPFEAGDFWLWLGMLAVAFLFMRVGAASEKVSSLTGKLVLYAAGIIGPAILAALYLILVVLEVDSPVIDNSNRTALINGELTQELRTELEYKDVRVPAKVQVLPDPQLPGWKLAGDFRSTLKVVVPADKSGKFLQLSRRIPSRIVLNDLREGSGGWITPDLADDLRHHGISVPVDASLETELEPRPRDIVLLVDNASPYGKVRQDVRSAFRKSLAKILSIPIYSDTRVAVISFDERIRLDSDFVHIGGENEVLLKAINAIDFSGQKTNEAPALLAALNKLAESGRESVDKVIVLVSDGILESGNKQLDRDMVAWIGNRFLDTANRRGIRIYGVVSSEIANYELIQGLTQGTGGEVFPAFDSGLMQDAFMAIHKRLSSDVLPSRWQIRDGEARHLLGSRDNGVEVHSRVPLDELSALELAKVGTTPVRFSDLTAVVANLKAAGFDPVPGRLWIQRSKADSSAWTITAPFEISIADQDFMLAIQWPHSWSHFWDGSTDMEFLALFAVLLLYRVLVEINATSVHSFYRDRLSRAFIFRLGPGKQLAYNDDLKLNELNREGTTAPYHLINVALNLHGSNDPGLRGRKAEFFIFSKLFTGSLRTGFSDTRSIEKLDSHLNLATAMAISGAAAAPNMGTTTVRQLVFLLTMLNIRLGYWLPNPQVVNEGSARKNFFMRFGVGARYLLRESLGRLTDRGLFVNVSDGGHLENLGMYELLRRRCRYIISVDGEADPAMGFNGLVKLILYARIDLGIVIDIDLDPVRKNADGTSNWNWATGTIHYGEHETGHLLYIKSSRSGDENEYIREYHSRNPAFPHESTIDQFFDETQFEAYRALGFHIGRKLFSNDDELGAFKALRSESS